MTPEQRFEKYWEQVVKPVFDGRKSTRGALLVRDATYDATRNAFLNAFKVCNAICKAWYNKHGLEGSNVGQIMDIWQTIQGTHPNLEVKNMNQVIKHRGHYIIRDKSGFWIIFPKRYVYPVNVNYMSIESAKKAIDNQIRR